LYVLGFKGGIMGIFLRAAFVGAFLFFHLNVATSGAVDLKEVERLLTGDGLPGLIHGAVDSADQFVLNYQVPGNFFDSAKFPLTTTDPTVRDTLATFRRHDRVLVKGKFIENGAPVRHILVREITLVKKYEPALEEPAYNYQVKIPDDLKDKTELRALVHAVAQDGHMLVLEYKDAVLPIFMKDNAVAKGLYRNDKIKLKFKLQEKPGHPTHLIPDPESAQPLVVLERIADLHEKPASVEGNLVLFQQSPEIKFNVFALQQTDADGLIRDFTLLNFEDPELFAKIREKLQKIWDDGSPEGVVSGRNKLVNTRIRVRATGTFNEIDPNQANAQILLAGPDAVEQISPK
jgi:hypothetical protein